MAGIINNRNVKDVLDAFEVYFPEDLTSFTDRSFSSQDFSFVNRQAFIKFVGEQAKIYIDATTPQATLVQAAKDTVRKIALEQPDRATPENLKQLEEDAARVEGERQKTIADSKKAVQDSINRQLERAKDLKEAQLKKVYAEVKINAHDPTPAEISADKAVADLKANNLNYSIDNFTQVIEEKITPSLSKDNSPEYIHKIAENTAIQYAEAINNPEVVAKYQEAAVQDAILAATANNPHIPEHIRQAAAEIAATRRIPIEITRKLVQASFGEGAGKFFGEMPGEISVIIHSNSTPQTTNTVDFERLNNGYGNLLQNQLNFIDSIGDLPAGEAKDFLFKQLGNAIDLKISALPANSLIRGLYGNATVKNIFSFATGQPISLAIDSETWFGGLALKAPGGLSTLNSMGGMFGVNFTTGGTEALGTVSAIGEVGKDAATLATTQAITTGAEVTGEAVTGTGIAAGATAFFAWTGPLAPVLGVATAFLVNVVGGEIIKNAISRVSIFISKHKEDFIALVGLAAGAAIFRSVPGAIGMGLFGYFGARSFYKGIGGLGNGFFRFGSRLGRIVSKSLFNSIIKPLLIITVLIPILVAFALFIINSGAYVVPPSDLVFSSTNAYISVEKTADPSGQVPSPTTITYTVTISAKKDDLTGITIKSECHAIKKGSTKDCPQEQIPSPPDTISAGSPFTFKITSNYDASYQDSLVSNTVTVSATSSSGGKVSEVGSASVCFGNCPLNCFDFSDSSWKQNTNLQSMLTTAASNLVGRYPNFAAKVCPAGGPPVKICYTISNPGPGSCSDIFAKDVEESGGCTINFNKCVGLAQYQPDGPLFLLTHEVTHHIQNMKGPWLSKFMDQVYPSERSVCSYGGSAPEESMAEGNALFVAKPIIDQNGSCIVNYQSQFPLHYKFARDVMFGP